MTPDAPAAPASPAPGPVRRALVLFDGDCGLCTALALRARDRDRAARFRIEPYQNWSDAELAGVGLTRARCAGAMQVVSPRGRRYPGALGVNYFLWHAGGWGRLLALLGALPPLLLVEMGVYALVARHRARLSRRLGLAACVVCPRDGRGAD